MPGLADGRVDEPLDDAWFANVPDHDRGAASRSLDAVRGLLHGCLGSTAQDHVGTPSPQALGDRAPDPT